MKDLLRKQLERAREGATDGRAVLRRLLPLVLREYNRFAEEISRLRAGLDSLQGRVDEQDSQTRAFRHRQLRAVLDNVKDAILSVSGEGIILSVNPAGERMFEYDASYLSGQPLALVLPVPEDGTTRDWLQGLAEASSAARLDGSMRLIDGKSHSGAALPLDIVVSSASIEGEELFIVGARDVTAQARAEQALRDSEARYRSLVDSAPEAVVVYDVQSEKFCDCNEAALRLFRTDRDTLESLGPKDLSPELQPDGSPSFGTARGHIESALGGETPVFEWQHCDVNGREVPCEVRLSRISFGERRLVRASITDITQRKRDELLAAGEKNVLEMVAANAALNEILVRVTDTISESDPDANCAILLLSRHGDSLELGSASGLPRALTEAMDGLPVASLAGEAAPNLSLAETLISADMGSDPLWSRYRELARNHGLEACWSTPIRSSEDSIVGALAVFYRDAHARIAQSFDLFDRMNRLTGIAIERKLAERALRSSEARFRGLFENVLDGVYQVSAEGFFISANPALVKMLGYETEEELMAMGPTSCLYVNPDDRLTLLDEIARTGQIRNAEFKLRRRDGSVIVVLENARVVKDESGGVVAYEGTLSDITDRKRAEVAVQEEKERAEVTLKSIADAVVTTDADGKIDYMNPVAEELTGWREAEVAGRPVTQVIRIVHETSREPLPNPVETCLREGRVTAPGQHSLLLGRADRQVAVQDTAAPIRDRHGRVAGAVMVFHDMSQERSLRHQLAYQATHDPLTGLINRREFETRLSEALRAVQEDPATTHVLLYLDLDQFKVVNDTCGHPAGDQLLQQVTSLITRRVRGSDIVCRLGGDEFGILLEDCALERAVEVADALRLAICEYRFFFQDAAFDIGVSIGIVAMSEESESVASLLSAADVACYAAKDLGRNRLHVYQHGDAAERHAEMQWVSKVTKALEDQRLELFYQPIVPIGDNHDRRGHYELLLRMRDEEGRLVAPNAFIPAAERYNMMPTLDRWVISEALRDLADRGGGERDESYTLAINLSGTSLNDDAFLNFVLEELGRYRLVPGAICFEITETAAISNLSRVAHFMTELKKQGCEFSLDDFGSGLSSFTYLKNLPVDYLKIDGHFIRNIMTDRVDQTMVNAITQVGNVMGIRTVAEHVESREVLDTLVAIGVEFAQGYFIARPAPVSEFERPQAVPRASGMQLV
jgi:diguanylate cyclase (GGDEF)-like protein/PAS domain S-box-containing protein